MLCACEEMPHLSVFGPNYQPMTYDVAKMAAPAPVDAPAAPASPPVVCRVTKGSAKFGEAWEDFRPADFTVTRDTHVTVALAPLKGEKEFSFQAWYDDAGQKMIFCPVVEGPPDQKISCSSIYALDDDIDDGIKRTFDIPSAVQGGMITCAHEAGKLKK
jgi:hypothetical protein